ncbi:uncharacterized protein LOC101850292 [Aplysia californica]|uniref:Uncharacterized protein LOC101850292 n=1 Tax=Aplysia californica TaxID=6500 RepID=A0ABM0K7W9_APLCA|nr:uncharacterized protein LOC101850292 [Aplysia californica]
MFPRPSRVLRLAIFLTAAVSVCLCVYLITVDLRPTSPALNVPQLAVGPIRAERRIQRVDIQVDPPGGVSSATRMASSTSKQDGYKRELFDQRVRAMIQRAERLSSLTQSAVGALGKPLGQPTIVNPHNFRYIHNPSKLCQRVAPRFLIYIHSSPGNLKKRQVVRQTWGHPRVLALYNASMVFLLGRSSPQLQSLVDMESRNYGDIVQEDFVDSYRNLTHKGIAGLKWVSSFCRQAEFLLKTDDDILLDFVSLMEHFLVKVLPGHGGKRLVLCNLWTRMQVLRDTKSKWYISREEFPADYFPAYCSGSAFLLSADLAPPLYNTALRTPFFWVDDYYVTGLLVNTLGIKHVRLNSAYLMDYSVVEERLRNDSRELMVFHVKRLNRFLSLWPRLVQRHPGMADYLSDHVSFPTHDQDSSSSGGAENVNKIEYQDSKVKSTSYPSAISSSLVVLVNSSASIPKNSSFPSDFNYQKRKEENRTNQQFSRKVGQNSISYSKQRNRQKSVNSNNIPNRARRNDSIDQITSNSSSSVIKDYKVKTGVIKQVTPAGAVLIRTDRPEKEDHKRAYNVRRRMGWI